MPPNKLKVASGIGNLRDNLTHSYGYHLVPMISRNIKQTVKHATYLQHPLPQNLQPTDPLPFDLKGLFKFVVLNIGP